MPVYRYELRRGDEIVATGHLSHEPPLKVGETIAIAGFSGLIRSVEPRLDQEQLQIIVQLTRNGDGPAFGS